MVFQLQEPLCGLVKRIDIFTEGEPGETFTYFAMLIAIELKYPK